MSAERVASSIREALDVTAPSEAEILRRVRAARARSGRSRGAADHARPLRNVAFAFAVVAACVALWLGIRTAVPPPELGITREVMPLERPPAPSSTHAESRPGPAEPRPVAPSLSEPPARVLPSASARPSRPPATPAVEPSSAGPSWEDVARALREGDDARARALTQRLGKSSDAATRDNARLTQIQLSLGGAGEAPSPSQLQELRDLKERGATSSVRASARRILDQIEKSKP